MPGDRRQLFREQAFARRGRTEPLDGLLRVTAPHEWIVLSGLALTLLGAVIWAVFGSIERTLSTECLLVQPGERYAVLAEVTGNVAAVLVNPGDRVEAGEPIAKIKMPGLAHQVRAARARVLLLEEGSSGRDSEEMRLARAELLDLEAIQRAGEHLISPYAGTVAWHGLAVGQAVVAGAEIAGIRSGTDGDLQAVAVVPPESAQRLEAGMETRVLLRGAQEMSALQAQIREVAPQAAAPPGWLSALGFPATGRSHMVWVTLEHAPDSRVADGAPCSLRVTLSRDAPVRLLGPF